MTVSINFESQIIKCFNRFFVTLAPCPKLDGKHVVFGKVVEGLDIVKEVVKKCEPQKNETPKHTVTISECGVCGH